MPIVMDGRSAAGGATTHRGAFAARQENETGIMLTRRQARAISRSHEHDARWGVRGSRTAGLKRALDEARVEEAAIRAAIEKRKRSKGVVTIHKRVSFAEEVEDEGSGPAFLASARLRPVAPTGVPDIIRDMDEVRNCSTSLTHSMHNF